MNDNINKLEKKIFRLQAFCAIIVLVGGGILLMGFSSDKKQKFGEIDVERINIVEKNGKLDMVISNQERQHPGISDGEIIKRKSPRPPGILFFDQSGDEMGGLIFGDNGGKGHFGSFTFDKVNNDQTIQINHLESDNGEYETGIVMQQRPNISSKLLNPKFEAAAKITDEKERETFYKKMLEAGELSPQRLYLGKTRKDNAVLALSDIKGNVRILLKVEPNGNPELNFLDENGKVIYSLPEDAKAKK